MHGCTPPKFNIAPENWWLEDDPFLLGLPIFRGKMLNFRRVVSFNVSSSTHLGIVFFHLLPPTARPLRNVQQQKKHALEGWQGKELTHEVPLFFTKFGNYSYDFFKSSEVVHPIMVLWKMRCLTLGIGKIIMFPHFLGARNSSLTYIAFGNQAKTPVRVSHDWRQALFIDSNFWTINESIIAPEGLSWTMNVDFLLERGWISRFLRRVTRLQGVVGLVRPHFTTLWYLSHEKNPCDIPSYWLFHRDPYNGSLQPRHNWVVLSPIYPKQPGLFLLSPEILKHITTC